MTVLALALLAAASDPTGCFAATRAIAAGEAIAQTDITEVACRSQNVAPLFRYERQSREVSARLAIEPGQYLGRVWVPSALAVERGASVEIIARVGVVEIRREVTALQDARSGQSFFVMDANGEIFVAPPMAQMVGGE